MDDFYNFVNYVEMADKYFDEFNVEQIPRKYIRNMEDPFEKYNDSTFLKRFFVISSNTLITMVIIT